MTIDAHAHVSDQWYEPVEILLTHMKANDVRAAVLVQMGGQHDNTYQERCRREHPGTFASVVSVPVDDRDALHILREAAQGGAGGVRLKASSRSPGTDPFAIWKEAQQLGLVVSCIAHSTDVAHPGFSELLSVVPGLPITLEHLGEARRANPLLTEEKARSLYELLKPWPNVHVKIHGLGEGGPRARPLTDPPYADTPRAPLVAYDILGPQRLLWGSDFPPVSGREGYANALRHTRALLRDHGMTPEEEASIFGGLAGTLFRLSD